MTDPERLAALAPRIMNAFHSFRPPGGGNDRLSRRQYQALMIIGSSGGIDLSQLGDMLKIAPSTATELADRMVDLGLIEKRRGPGDRRQVLLRLSGKGGELLRRRRDDLTGMFERMLGALVPRDRSVIVKAFSSIGEIAGKLGRGSAS
jgi:DNA-binding MarR family transcriptional regulator